MVSTLELVDKQILNVIQSDFPVVERPYKAIGEQVGVSEQDVIDRIAAMKSRNIVRQISAIFDTRRLGYKTTLVAMRFPEDALDAAAHVINQHPGVSHNYARDGWFNLWFTVAVPPNEGLEETVDRMANETGAEAYRLMPTIRFFKIGVNFDMVKEEGAAEDYYSPDGYNSGGVSKNWNKVEAVTDFEIAIVRELQEDFDLTARPYDGMTERLGITCEQLAAKAEEFKERGILRRVSAVLHHRRAGFRANAMAVWRVPEERAEDVGSIMAGSKWVTHCYQRPTYPNWPYSHFTMIHATTQEQCENVAREIANASGIDDYLLLYSTREYKKTRVRYFV
jgi:DNA-binding Lrp family transcriptional regulator